MGPKTSQITIFIRIQQQESRCSFHFVLQKRTIKEIQPKLFFSFATEKPLEKTTSAITIQQQKSKSKFRFFSEEERQIKETWPGIVFLFLFGTEKPPTL